MCQSRLIVSLVLRARPIERSVADDYCSVTSVFYRVAYGFGFIASLSGSNATWIEYDHVGESARRFNCGVQYRTSSVHR